MEIKNLSHFNLLILYMEKQCFKCNQVKPLSEYYKHAQMGDGHLNKCKSCTRQDVKKQYDINILSPELYEKEKQRQREKYYRLSYKEKHKRTPEQKKQIMKRYEDRYPEKKACRSLCSQLKPKTKGNNLHHWSYNTIHAKSVIELSQKDHFTAHRFLVYDQERMMYRTTEGVLLDTKESHEAYIYSKIQEQS